MTARYGDNYYPVITQTRNVRASYLYIIVAQVLC